MNTKTISQLVSGLEATVHGSAGTNITSLCYDSRKAAPGAMFFAVPGTVSDGHDFIDRAVEAGAAAIVCQRLPETLHDDVTYVEVADSNVAMGRIAAEFYDHPSRELKLVGITGTNGKTTTATLLYDLFRAAGYRAGLISTVVYRIDDREIASTHTTPDALRLNEMLREMADIGCDWCFMEVSSHSIVQHRIEGLRFAGGIFTNITHDHLDYHKTFAEYIRAKKMFFDSLPREAFALVNKDDRNGEVMVQNTRAAVKTFSLRSMADFRCRIREMLFDGMLLDIDGREVWVRLTGRFNAYNLLGIYAAAVLLGLDRDETLRILSGLGAVSGRFEALHSECGITALVDYAHTPDALENVIETVNEIRREGQRLFTVVGCGGNRDAAKRPEMAHIAASQSYMAILTSDNPRLEDPEEILRQMEAGIEPGDRSLKIADRREAIKCAVSMAAPGDIVLIAGKGHETYQDVGGVKHHFDDREEARRFLDEADARMSREKQ